jgi:hypothetical protein
LPPPIRDGRIQVTTKEPLKVYAAIVGGEIVQTAKDPARLRGIDVEGVEVVEFVPASLITARDAAIREEVVRGLRGWLEARRSSHMAQADLAKSAQLHNEYHELACELHRVLLKLDSLTGGKGDG